MPSAPSPSSSLTRARPSSSSACARSWARAGGLSFASPELLAEHLGVPPGAMSALAAISDRAGAVRVFLDRGLLAAEGINCHPITNPRTTVAPQGLLAYLEATGHPATILSLAGEDET